jgi:hypothetical protein
MEKNKKIAALNGQRAIPLNHEHTSTTCGVLPGKAIYCVAKRFIGERNGPREDPYDP